jgi:hypothetical protein
LCPWKRLISVRKAILAEELTMIQAMPEPAATVLAVPAVIGARGGQIRRDVLGERSISV